MTLEMKNGCLSVGESRFFSGLNFRASQGETVCVQGVSPLACTHLLRCLLGFEPLSEGFISIDGSVLSPASAATFRRLMAYVPRELLLPYPSMAQAARAPFRLKANARQAFSTEALLKEWQLLGLPSSLLDKQPAQLTDSQRLRAALASASLLGKSILLVDAPPTRPDSAAAQFIDNYLHQLASRGTAVVAVSADDVFAASCNRIVTITENPNQP
jgi:polar amino acid transport system ATP-binding protein/putative ABC transport system ATP-binding protein